MHHSLKPLYCTELSLITLFSSSSMASSNYTLQGLLEIGLHLTNTHAMPSIFSTLIAIIVVGFLVYLYAPYWAVRHVPGPPTIPLLGHLHLLSKYGPDVFTVLAKQYGPVFRFHMGRQPLIIIADAELCREVGIKKFKDVSNRSIPSPISGSSLHKKGLFFTRDTKWSSMRNSIISIYQPSHLSSLLPTMQSIVESSAQNLPTSEHEDIVFSDLSLKLATDVIGQAAFGFDFGLTKETSHTGSKNVQNDVEVADFIKQHMYSTTTLKMDLSGSFSIILGLVCPILRHPFQQILKRVPGTTDWKVDQTNRKLINRLDQIVEKRAKAKDRGSKDFLSLILNAREEEKGLKNVFTSDYIRALVYEQLLAGSATTSFTLSSILYLVAAHPEVEKKLMREIDNSGGHDLIPTTHALQHNFPYLDQVVKEAMRFYTVSPLVAREASKQVDIGGYVLPKGTWIWLALGVLAKDPKYFAEPNKFQPERFDPTCEEDKRRHPYAHIPFGIGPRQCIGMKFSIQEIKLTLIHLYRGYLFQHSPNMEKPLALEYGIVLNFKYGVKLRVIKRST